MIDKGDEHLPLLNRLKEYRSRLGVNQTEMGKLAGVSRQTTHRGRRIFLIIPMLCRACQIQIYKI